jgi:signal transduction histidine kinase
MVSKIIQHIGKAILLVTPEFKVGNEHSKFAVKFFEKPRLAGVDICELLFESKEQLTRGAELKKWLACVFSDAAIWPMLGELGVREARVKDRELELEWSPIVDGKKITAMILLCSDITEQRRFEAERFRKDLQHAEELEILIQALHLPSQVVDQFVMDLKRLVTATHEILARGPAVLDDNSLNEIMRYMHTIKGSAHQLNLLSIQKRAHWLEALIIALRGDVAAGEEGQKRIYREIHEANLPIESSLNRICAIYDKVILGKGREQKSEEIASSAKVLFDRLEYLAAFLAAELHLDVKVIRKGDDVVIRPEALSLLGDAFSHLVRNSIDHGAESPQIRVQQRKPPALTITLSAQRGFDESVVFEISDDGKGINLEQIKKSILDRGLMSKRSVHEASSKDLLDFVFLPGFSTRSVATTISGRGVGMDVVRNIIEKMLSGSVSLESESGKGTRLRVFVPGFAMKNIAIAA